MHILGLLDLKEEEHSLRTYVQQSMDYLEKEGVDELSRVGVRLRKDPFHHVCRHFLSSSFSAVICAVHSGAQV